MDYEGINGFDLINCHSVNVIIGKNGSGKSFLLRQAEQGFRGTPNAGLVRYISPERSGILQYEAGVDQAMQQNVSWLDNERRRNQVGNFKPSSMAALRQLELAYLRRRDTLVDRNTMPTFQETLAKINSMLERVSIKQDDRGSYSFADKNGNPISALDISSGESELFSLAIEFLGFRHNIMNMKENFLLIDEPDIHLYPDLQYKLAKYLLSLAGPDCRYFIATHSTAFLSALCDGENTSIAFMERGIHRLEFMPISNQIRAILPIFGAHPLSNLFAEMPIVLVEGDDDERIWQQVVRSSQGKIRLFPCVVGDKDKLHEFEIETDRILRSLFDSAVGYSIRDQDQTAGSIEDLGRVKRFRLACRSAENLMLTNEVLESAGKNWGDLKRSIDNWINTQDGHIYHEQMKNFQNEGYIRQTSQLKEIRNIINSMLTNKQWEVFVGQAITKSLTRPHSTDDNSISQYLGEKLDVELGRLWNATPNTRPKPATPAAPPASS